MRDHEGNKGKKVEGKKIKGEKKREAWIETKKGT